MKKAHGSKYALKPMSIIALWVELRMLNRRDDIDDKLYYLENERIIDERRTKEIFWIVNWGEFISLCANSGMNRQTVE